MSSSSVETVAVNREHVALLQRLYMKALLSADSGPIASGCTVEERRHALVCIATSLLRSTWVPISDEATVRTAVIDANDTTCMSNSFSSEGGCAVASSVSHTPLPPPPVLSVVDEDRDVSPKMRSASPTGRRGSSILDLVSITSERDMSLAAVAPQVLFRPRFSEPRGSERPVHAPTIADLVAMSKERRDEMERLRQLRKSSSTTAAVAPQPLPPREPSPGRCHRRPHEAVPSSGGLPAVVQASHENTATGAVEATEKTFSLTLLDEKSNDGKERHIADDLGSSVPMVVVGKRGYGDSKSLSIVDDAQADGGAGLHTPPQWLKERLARNSTLLPQFGPLSLDSSSTAPLPRSSGSPSRSTSGSLKSKSRETAEPKRGQEEASMRSFFAVGAQRPHRVRSASPVRNRKVVFEAIEEGEEELFESERRQTMFASLTLDRSRLMSIGSAGLPTLGASSTSVE